MCKTKYSSHILYDCNTGRASIKLTFLMLQQTQINHQVWCLTARHTWNLTCWKHDELFVLKNIIEVLNIIERAGHKLGHLCCHDENLPFWKSCNDWTKEFESMLRLQRNMYGHVIELLKPSSTCVYIVSYLWISWRPLNK